MRRNWIKRLITGGVVTLLHSAILLADEPNRAKRARDTFWFHHPPEPTVSYEVVVPQGLDSEPELHYSIEEALEQQFWSDAEGNFPEPRYPSIVLIPTQMAGGRVVVVPITKVLIVMPRWLFSNGQAGNWNRLPQGYQDARTLSFPMR